MKVDPLHVPAGERGVVRLFSTELEPEGAAAITSQSVHRLLGEGVTLDPSKVEVFPSRALEAMPLSLYLSEAYGIDEADLDGRRAALDALKGLIVIVPSSAFGGREQNLDPNPALRLVGVFREPAPEAPAIMARHSSAEGRLAAPDKAPPPSITPAGRSWVGAIGALILAAVLVFLLTR